MEDLAEKDAYSYSIPVIKQEIILKAEIQEALFNHHCKQMKVEMDKLQKLF